MDEPRTIKAEHCDRRIVEPDEIREIHMILIPVPGIDAVQALRGLLKVALRRFGLRCKRINTEGKR